MKSYPVGDLVLDMTIYPRREIDREHVYQIAKAMELRVAFPPIVICRKSLRIIDGAHRVTAAKQVFGLEAQIECVEKHYRDERELFLDAVRLNASHGKPLTAEDRAVCAFRATQLKVDISAVATVLSVDREYLSSLHVALKNQLYSEAVDIPKSETQRQMRGFDLSSAKRKAYLKREKPAENGKVSEPEEPEVRIDQPIEDCEIDVAEKNGEEKRASQPVVGCGPRDDREMATYCAKTLVDLFESEKIGKWDDRLRELCEILNWHIEEVFGFTAK